MVDLRKQFTQVWVIDFEFFAPPGERPRPICMVGREFFSGQTHRIWFKGQTSISSNSPFSCDRNTLVVAYYASAEMGCFLALDWELPGNLLDLFTEHRLHTNQAKQTGGNSLVGALHHHGLPAIEVAEKDAMRDLAMRGGPYSAEEKQQLLKYCESDVVSTTKLLSAMLPRVDLPRALHRGRYMRAVADMEWAGVPIDRVTLDKIRANWVTMQEELIRRVDADYGVFDGTTFKRDRFADFLFCNGIPWPRTETGELMLREDTFRRMAKCHPIVAPLRELRHSLGELRLENLYVGSDTRNRCLLSPFRSSTSRNQPSNAKFIFGPSCWIRGLIKPAPGKAVAYVDWSQQEFAIAAALSGDQAMQQAYLSADPYLTFAKQAKAVPESATKQSHPREREQFKVCALGVQYGMQARSLSQALQLPEVYARELLKLHRQTYPRYWRWSEDAVSFAMLYGYLETVFGWRVHVTRSANVRGLANFPMQANGAEMLRLACCLATESGLTVCAPVHDALLVEADAGEIEEVVEATQKCMLEAGRIVLDGFELRTDAEIVRWPDRYMDKRGEKMWATVMSILNQIDRDSEVDIPAPMREDLRTHAAPSHLFTIFSEEK